MCGGLEVGLEGSLVHWVAANNMAVCAVAPDVSDASCDHSSRKFLHWRENWFCFCDHPVVKALFLIQLSPARVSTQWPVANSTHLSILAKWRPVALLPPLCINVCLFVPMWAHAFLSYSVDYNPCSHYLF